MTSLVLFWSSTVAVWRLWPWPWPWPYVLWPY